MTFVHFEPLMHDVLTFYLHRTCRHAFDGRRVALQSTAQCLHIIQISQIVYIYIYVCVYV